MMTHVTVTTPPCMACGERSQMLVSAAQYEAWRAGEFIQNAFPNLTADERELLMTGTHPTCWDDMFGEEE